MEVQDRWPCLRPEAQPPESVALEAERASGAELALVAASRGKELVRRKLELDGDPIRTRVQESLRIPDQEEQAVEPVDRPHCPEFLFGAVTAT
jgi:hypothetical protein